MNAFVRFYETLYNGDSVDNPRAWLLRVGHNLAINMISSKGFGNNRFGCHFAGKHNPPDRKHSATLAARKLEYAKVPSIKTTPAPSSGLSSQPADEVAAQRNIRALAVEKLCEIKRSAILVDHQTKRNFRDSKVTETSEESLQDPRNTFKLTDHVLEK